MKIKKNNLGFSLIELMIVISIIGVLAALGMPKFKTFQAKARQSEVKTSLNQIYVLQESFHAENDRYTIHSNVTGNGAGTCTETNIGFKLTNCTKVRYNYHFDLYTANPQSFFASGTSLHGANNKVCPGAIVPDIWILWNGGTKNKVFDQQSDGVTGC